MTPPVMLRGVFAPGTVSEIGTGPPSFAALHCALSHTMSRTAGPVKPERRRREPAAGRREEVTAEGLLVSWGPVAGVVQLPGRLTAGRACPAGGGAGP